MIWHLRIEDKAVKGNLQREKISTEEMFDKITKRIKMTKEELDTFTDEKIKYYYDNFIYTNMDIPNLCEFLRKALDSSGLIFRLLTPDIERSRNVESKKSPATSKSPAKKSTKKDKSPVKKSTKKDTSPISKKKPARVKSPKEPVKEKAKTTKVVKSTTAKKTKTPTKKK
jgi:hypothetical protein